MPIAAGTRFGPYEVGEAIGAGGMGEVFRATDTNLKRDVAVKVLPASFANDADRLARFQREAEVLASLNHANIAQIYGLEKANEQTVIVMELVEGPTLADRIAEGPMPPDEALGIARQVADALEAAHGAQVVHRDLKPANINLKPDGTIKVLDFGIAKALDPEAISGSRSPVMTTPAVTETGVILGTAAYMSPEQARGKPVDQRTDVWAFGCLLFEMLTGQPAFGGEDVMLTLARVLDRDTDLSSMPGTISPAVRHTIKLCLEKDPRRRIADIRDVRLALEGVFEMPLARSAESVIARPAWQRLMPIAATAVVVATVTWLAGRVLDAEAPPQVRRSVHVIPEDQPLNNTGPPMIAISPDGDRIAFGAGGALYLRRLSELDARPVPGTGDDSPIVPVFSPDGDSLLYGSFVDGQLKRISADGGTALPVLPQWASGGWRWDEDGMIRDSDACRIRQVPPAGGTPEVLFEDDSGFNCFEPTRLPGGNALLYERRPMADSNQPEIAILALETGEAKALFPGKQPQYLAPGYLIYFDTTLGLMARAFDPGTLEYGNPVALVDDVFSVGPTAGAQFRISATGTLVYIRGEAGSAGTNVILALASETGAMERLDVAPRDFVAPAVSPAGNQVAVQVGAGETAQIFVYDLSGDAEIRQLTFQGASQHPTWTPDGQWLTYASNRDGRWRIYRQRADGRGVPEALTDPAESLGHFWPAWTADGERLAYGEAGNQAEPDIWIVALPDGEPELLVGGSGVQTALAFAPDGEALAYHSAESGTPEVFVEPFPQDGSRTRVSEEGIGSGWPVWSRDSTRLSYQVAGGGFAAVDFDTSGFAIRNRRQLPFAANPNVRRLDSVPGGERMLVTLPENQATSDALAGREIVIVENWLEEVKQRVPAL